MPSSSGNDESRAVSPSEADDSIVGATTTTTLSFANAPKPWKKASYKRDKSKRTKNAKQILSMERERQLGPNWRKPQTMGPRKRAAAAKAAAAAEAEAALAAENGEAMDVDESAGTGSVTPAVADTQPAPTPSAPAITCAYLTAQALTVADYSIEAPPSIRPIKKYCDVTGLIAPYTDPRSRLRYHNPEIFALLKTFAPSTEQAYLSTRGSGAVLR